MNTTFNDTYEIRSVIGKGGMSTVYLARHKRLGTSWAVKQVARGQGIDILAESNLLKRLKHPMLPRIVDIFEDREYIYIVEDYVEGVTLADWLQEHRRVEEEQGILWFKGLCNVLGYLHSQQPNPIIYRDMKPSNIMLQPDGTLKLIDFGIAREYKQGSQADTTYIGTKGYAAPEQFGTAQTDERTDIYALGVTMYHLLTGKSPYEPPYQFVPARELEPSLSRGMEYILGRCIQPEPADRYQNVGELLEDLNNIYRFDEAYQRFRRAGKRRTAILGVLLGLSLALLVGGRALMAVEDHGVQSSIDSQYAQLLDQAAAEADPEAALALIEEARELRPERVESFRSEAYVLYTQGDYTGCVQFAQEQLAQWPEDSGLLLILASASFELGDYETAADCFYRGSRESDMSADNLRDYAVCLGRMGDIDGAQEVLEELMGQGASPDVTDYVRGEVYYAQEDYAAAESAFLAALGATDDPLLMRRCYLSLGEVYRDDRQYSKAIELLQEALAQPGLQGNTVLYEQLGAAYYNRGTLEGHNDRNDLTQAAQYFQQVLDGGIVKDYLYVNVFTAWQAIGEYDKAGAALDAMEAQYPNSYVPHALRGTLYIMIEGTKEQYQRDYHPALEEYEQAQALVTSQDDTTYLQQLEGQIQQLRDGNWL